MWNSVQKKQVKKWVSTFHGLLDLHRPYFRFLPIFYFLQISRRHHWRNVPWRIFLQLSVINSTCRKKLDWFLYRENDLKEKVHYGR